MSKNKKWRFLSNLNFGKKSKRGHGNYRSPKRFQGDVSPYDIVDNTTDGYVPEQAWTFDSFDDSTNAPANPRFVDLMVGDIDDGKPNEPALGGVIRSVERAQKYLNTSVPAAAPPEYRTSNIRDAAYAFKQAFDKHYKDIPRSTGDDKYRKFYDSVVSLVTSTAK